MKLARVVDMTKYHEVGDIVGYEHYHKPNTNAWRQDYVAQPQYGSVWRVVSYNAMLIPYDLATEDDKFLREEYTKLYHSNKIKGKKRLLNRFYGWKIRLKSLTNGKYVLVGEEELYKNPNITTEVVKNNLLKRKRKEVINNLLK